MAGTIGHVTEHFYASSWIDRAAHLRADADWLRQRIADPTSVFVPVWRQRSLLITGDEPTAELLRAVDMPAPVPLHEAVFLGLSADRAATFAVLLPDASDPDSSWRQGGAAFADLRQLGPLMTPEDAGLLAYARAVGHWHATHRFCGSCGAATESLNGGWLRRCSNVDCARQHFPRTDPAIIVRVVHGERILLGRQAAWPKRWYSVLAGFVEPGESLEEAVRREVLEETGITCSDVRYVSAQPWPFPASLMLGFSAVAESETISRGDEELEDARWFTREQIATGVAAGELRLSPAISISRTLIDAWIEQRLE